MMKTSWSSSDSHGWCKVASVNDKQLSSSQNHGCILYNVQIYSIYEYIFNKRVSLNYPNFAILGGYEKI